MTTPAETIAPATSLHIDGAEIAIEGERNLLELVRKAGIDLPTFCYHSDLSIYGACRLCLVEVDGRGIVAACSTPPEPGLRVRTQTEELRDIRRIAIELLLANHGASCTTCAKNTACQLQALARRFGIDEVRFKPVHTPKPVDRTSPALVRDANKCVLCGDCVRFCAEVQGIGAIDFAYRGHQTQVLPAFGRDLGDVECVHCGQCAAVCPTGALAPRSAIDEVWAAIHHPQRLVVAQIAPAVRVALGEAFGDEPGEAGTGRMVAALRRLGFDLVYDTAFAADLTVVEEANEFIARKRAGVKLPQFTSCCPGWVKYAEQYFPELLPNLSTCRSPQQMLGAMIKHVLPAERGLAPRDVVVVAIMPCTAKKFEARRPELARDGVPDVDHVLTTQELARMITEAGLQFRALEPSSFDQPMGFKTGAGVIFGNSGGVSEAVLRYAAEALGGQKTGEVDFPAVRGEQAVRLATIKLGGLDLKLAVVHGLKNAGALATRVLRGEIDLDLIEVMACPGGCIGGAGQPVIRDRATRRRRTKGLYDQDKHLDLHTSQENVQVRECYRRHLGDIGGHEAHRLLHTHYANRRRIAGAGMEIQAGAAAAPRVRVETCVGTSCFLRGSQKVLQALLAHVDERGLKDRVDVVATFCFEACAQGPSVTVQGRRITGCTPAAAIAALDRELNPETDPAARAGARKDTP